MSQILVHLLPTKRLHSILPPPALSVPVVDDQATMYCTGNFVEQEKNAELCELVDNFLEISFFWENRKSPGNRWTRQTSPKLLNQTAPFFPPWDYVRVAQYVARPPYTRRRQLCASL